MAAQNLHNAGNDARYTLECILGQVAMNTTQQTQYAQGPTSGVEWERDDSAAFIVEKFIEPVHKPLML